VEVCNNISPRENIKDVLVAYEAGILSVQEKKEKSKKKKEERFL